MKRIAVFGSTGSIGQNALEIARNFSDEFKVVGLSANSNVNTLYGQIKEFHPEFACVNDPIAAKRLKSQLNFNHTKILFGQDSLSRLDFWDKIDLVVLAISGSGALLPLIKAIGHKKKIALANKEALVMAGPIIMGMARKNNVKIVPIDSEQSAIWQCLDNQDKAKLKNIYLTASGGPFVNKDKKYLKHITVAQVLRHPRWKMGQKVTVDSATLMNKGLEVIEAMYLFGLPLEKIKVVIHPEAIIHSMVEFIDKVVMAQLSVTDMRIPIQYAMSYPDRLKSSMESLDFFKIKSLNFSAPDIKKFPCLGLAYQAAESRGTMPAVLNAANEVTVGGFLDGRLKFVSIPYVVGKVMDAHKNRAKPGLEDIIEADLWARGEACRVINNINK